MQPDSFRFRFVAFLITLAIIAPVEGSEPATAAGTPAPESVIEEFEIARDGDLLVVPIEIEGQDYKFVLSTYHNRHSVDELLFARRVFQTARRDVDNEGFPSRNYELSGSLGKSKQLVDGPADCKDLSKFRKSSGHDVYGIVGMRFLKTQIMRVDFENGKLAFLKSVPPDPGVALRLNYRENGAPIVDVGLFPGETAPFRVGIGNARFVSATIDSEHFQRLLDGKRVRVGDEYPATGHHGFLDELRIESVVENDLAIREADKNQLGQGFLARFLVVFDFPNRLMFLKRRAEIPVQLNAGECGFELVRISGKTYVESVEETGPGHDIGIREGDRLLKINGQDANGISLFNLRLILFERRNRVHIVIDRDDEIIEFDFLVAD